MFRKCGSPVACAVLPAAAGGPGAELPVGLGVVGLAVGLAVVGLEVGLGVGLAVVGLEVGLAVVGLEVGLGVGLAVGAAQYAIVNALPHPVLPSPLSQQPPSIFSVPQKDKYFLEPFGQPEMLPPK